MILPIWLIQKVDKTSFLNERDVILELVDVQPGVTYTIIPTTYEPGITRSFTLKAYSKNYVELKPLENTSDVKLKPVDQNSPVSAKSRSKPSSPRNHSAFKDIEANNVADVMTTNETNQTDASATVKDTDNDYSEFHEVDLSEEGIEDGTENENGDAKSVKNSRDRYVMEMEEARF